MAENCEPRLVVDLAGFIKLYSDGSVVREGEPSLSLSFPSPTSENKEDNFMNVVQYRDVVFEEELGLWARLYLPPQCRTANTRVPVFLYFYGSGFCFLSAANPLVQRMCQLWAAKLGVIMISVNYRLAPEHRLPAAYNDSIAALHWLQLQLQLQMQVTEGEGALPLSDPWLQSHADFSKIFLVGESAGANIAHHVGMWAAAAKERVEIRGLILVSPFFGGEERMPSEGGGDSMDAMWKLALPLGSNRNHPFCNPVREGAEAEVALPPVLYVIAGRDIMRDKHLQHSEFLKKCGNQVEVLMFDEEDHAFTRPKMEGKSSLRLLRCISDFIK